MGIVLFAEMYEIFEPTFQYQECKARYRLNENTIIENTIIKYNEYELRERDIKEISLENIRELDVKVNEDMFIEYEVVKKEME